MSRLNVLIGRKVKLNEQGMEKAKKSVGMFADLRRLNGQQLVIAQVFPGRLMLVEENGSITTQPEEWFRVVDWDSLLDV